MLLDKGANPNIQNNFEGTAPLHYGLCINVGLKVNYFNFAISASGYKKKFSNIARRELVELLLSKGANPDIKDKSGKTPLYYG